MAKHEATSIPWSSTGRITPAFRVTQSLLPCGILPFDPISSPSDEVPIVAAGSADIEKYLMRIMGTAVQVGAGKLLTTAETVAAVRPGKTRAAVLANIRRDRQVAFVPYPIQAVLPYIDPRTSEPNLAVDIALMIVDARSTDLVPYDVKPIRWADSTAVGVGDPVMVAGFPFGTDLFLEYKSNRGFIQPTVYSGVIGAIVPAMLDGETRLFRVTVPGIGGLSGGVVFNPKNGDVIGVVTTSMLSAALPQPVVYAVPSEVLVPYVKSISFTTERAQNA